MYSCVGARSNNTIDCCGHEHETRDEAQLCLLEHQKEMRHQNKISTRQIVEIDSLDQVYEESELY